MKQRWEWRRRGRDALEMKCQRGNGRERSEVRAEDVARPKHRSGEAGSESRWKVATRNFK